MGKKIPLIVVGLVLILLPILSWVGLYSWPTWLNVILLILGIVGVVAGLILKSEKTGEEPSATPTPETPASPAATPEETTPGEPATEESTEEEKPEGMM